MSNEAEPTDEDIEQVQAVLAGRRTGNPVPEDGRWRTFCHPAWSWAISTVERFPPCLLCSREANWKRDLA